MFDKDFYPTPVAIIDKMEQKVDWPSVKLALEPSAGKGNILDRMTRSGEYPYGRNRNFQNWEAIEKNAELNALLYGKGYRVVGSDFLTFQSSTEYDLIMANPPFSDGDKHLLRMIEFAEGQVYQDCQIVSLVNAETLKNPYSNTRKHILELLNKYDADVEYLDGAFLDAERTTSVDVALISLTVRPRERQTSFIDDLLNKCQETTQSFEVALPANEVGYSKDEIEMFVGMYQEHAKRFKKTFHAIKDLEVYASYLKKREDIMTYGVNDLSLNYNSELDKIRNAYWHKILKADKFREILTGRAIDDLMSKIASLSNLEPTLDNVYMMLLSLSQNREQMLVDTLETMFDELTKYHQHEFSKNIHYYNGWKSNNAFRLNTKVITPCHISIFYNYVWERTGYDDVHWEVKRIIEDLLKVLALVTETPLGDWTQKGDYEFENNVIRFKFFKKGTLHIWFKDRTALARLNFLVGQNRNWLPTDEEIKQNKKAKDYVAKEFPELKNNLLK